MGTYAALKELKKQYVNLMLGIQAVISNFSIDAFAELCAYVQGGLKPTEVARSRAPLFKKRATCPELRA